MAQAVVTDNAPSGAVGIDVSDAAEQLESLLDVLEESDEDKAAHSPQTDAPADADAVADADTGADAGADAGEVDKSGEQPTTYTVKVDGEEMAVTLAELQAGYQRNADYTRKTQKLSQEKREQQAEFDAVKQERAKYSTLLQSLDARLQAALPNEPNWDQLRAEDPVAFASQWAQHQRVQQQRAVIQDEQANLQRQQAADQQAQFRTHVQQEAAELVKVIPGWADPAKARTEKQALLEYGLSIGFSEQDLNNVYDHRAVVALYKAWRFDQLLQRKAAAQAKIGAAAVLKPGTGNSPRKVTDVTKVKQRLAQTGRVEDAAAFFERTL